MDFSLTAHATRNAVVFEEFLHRFDEITKVLTDACLNLA